MPNYDFKCSKCDFLATDVQLPIAERDEPVGQPCPTNAILTPEEIVCDGMLERVIAGPAIGYRIGGIKTPNAFKDVLRNIKKNHLRSTINV
jgi:hypothetical protein